MSRTEFSKRYDFEKDRDERLNRRKEKAIMGSKKKKKVKDINKGIDAYFEGEDEDVAEDYNE